MVKKTKSSGVKGVNVNSWYALAIARMMVGYVFLWAFFDKLFGLGVATPAARAWVNGGSPTKGFLMGAATSNSPFAGLFQWLSTQTVWTDWLFMLGLLGIGLALFCGVAMRLAAAAGAVLLVMMWMASLPLENNPFIDDHLIYAVLLVALAGIEQRWSIAEWWHGFDFVKKNRWLW